MSEALTAGKQTIEIRTLVGSTTESQHPAYRATLLHGVPRVLKRQGEQVRFIVAGRTFGTTVSEWNARDRGYIVATERR